MDNSGLNEIVLKRNAIAYWLQEPRNRPVKLTSISRHPTSWSAGSMTCWKFVAARTLQEAEQILGLRAHELLSGAYWYKLQRMPRQDEFDTRGYTQCPDGKVWTEDNAYPAGLGAAQWRIHDDAYIPSRLSGCVVPRGRFV